MASRRDFAEEIVDERRKRNPKFPDLVRAASERRMARRKRAEAHRVPRPTRKER